MKLTGLKRVYFSNECKTHDGSSNETVKYLEFIDKFLQRKIITVEDFINFISEPMLIRYFLDELKFAYCKLIKDNKDNKDDQDSDNEDDYQYMFDENREKDAFWDHITFVSKAYSFRKKNKGALVARFGCRDNNKKFTKEHINDIKRMIRLLEDAEELLFFTL